MNLMCELIVSGFVQRTVFQDRRICAQFA